MSKILFRPAHLADLAAIVALLAEDDIGQGREDVSEPLNRAYRLAFDAILVDANQLLAVCEKAGEVIGCLQISFLPGISRIGSWRGLIEGVRVAGRQRNQGVGRQMILWAIEVCRARNCLMVQLTTDKRRIDAHRFYASLGFEQSHEGFKMILS